MRNSGQQPKIRLPDKGEFLRFCGRSCISCEKGGLASEDMETIRFSRIQTKESKGTCQEISTLEHRNSNKEPERVNNWDCRAANLHTKRGLARADMENEEFSRNQTKKNEGTYLQISMLGNSNSDGDHARTKNLDCQASNLDFDCRAMNLDTKTGLASADMENEEFSGSQTKKNEGKYRQIPMLENPNLDVEYARTKNLDCQAISFDVGQDIMKHAEVDEHMSLRRITAAEDQNKKDKEYWRPSYMFHWLKATGKRISEAYKAFEEYEGRTSYEKIRLEPLEPMEQEEGYTEEWSHMSDYDDMCLAPGHGEGTEDGVNIVGMITPSDDSLQTEHRDDSKFRMVSSYDEDDEAQECKWGSETSHGLVKQGSRTYHIRGWQYETTDPTIVCFRGGRAIAGVNPYDERRICEDDDDEQMVCNMTGDKLEQLPFPIIIDSGACASVIPTAWCPHVPLKPTPQSEAGEYSRVANGEKIYNRGQKMVTMTTKEGAKRDMKFIACDEVSKALGSVSQMCRSGHRVVFNPSWDPNGSYTEHIESGEKLKLEESNGFYMLNTKVAPINKQTLASRKQSFGWQVSP